jgi:DNA polymerase-3 subunit epsilon
MQIAAFKYMRKNMRPENFKLSTVCRDFGLRVDEDRLHDGMYDITLTKNLYNKLLKF